MTWRHIGTGIVVALLLGLLATACGNSAEEAPSAATAASAANPTASAIEGNLTVFAAASLTDAFNEVIGAFEKSNPGVKVTPQYAGSSALRTQLEQGARADVYASADQAQMDTAKKNGVIAGAGDRIFVHNSLTIIAPAANPASIAAVTDLQREGLKLVLAAPEVPVGSYARQMLSRASADPAYGAGFAEAVLENLVSNEANVKQVVAKVELGEADAGIVYGSDVTPDVAPKLKTIAIPDAINVVADYPIAITKAASNPRAAQAFIDFVTGSAGQAILKKWGFQTG